MFALDKQNIEALTTPIVFTRPGLELFFSEQFNSPLYGAHILPAHFGHLAHFLHYSYTLPEPYPFVITVFDIFHMRLKDALWVNALSLSLLLEKLPQYLERLCVQKEQELLQESIKDILYQKFITRFSQLSQNPMDGINPVDTFLQNIDQLVNPAAQEIAALVEKNGQKRPVRELQELVTRFIESALEKVVWNPQSQQDTWDSACLLAEQVRQLHDMGIIYSPQVLNHLYWTIIYRYCHFLRSTKDTLEPFVFEYVQNHIATKEPVWLCGAETEPFLTAKTDYLKAVIWECLAEKAVNRL